MIENGWEDGRTKENGGNCWDMVKKWDIFSLQCKTQFSNRGQDSEINENPSNQRNHQRYQNQNVPERAWTFKDICCDVISNDISTFC